MHKTNVDLRDICEMKQKLISWQKEEFSKGCEGVDTCESGQVVDMIKDLAEAEKDCWKAKYYELMCCALEDFDGNDNMGYDNWRYSSGRFAPTGRGHFAGYPVEKDHTRMPGTVYSEDHNMGYPNMPTNPPMHRSQTGNVITSRYGYPYDEWNEARRHYTESRSEDNKKKMEHKAVEHVTGAVESIKHIWKEADPALKERLKKELHPLLEDLKKEGT